VLLSHAAGGERERGGGYRLSVERRIFSLALHSRSGTTEDDRAGRRRRDAHLIVLVLVIVQNLLSPLLPATIETGQSASAARDDRARRRARRAGRSERGLHDSSRRRDAGTSVRAGTHSARATNDAAVVSSGGGGGIAGAFFSSSPAGASFAAAFFFFPAIATARGDGTRGESVSPWTGASCVKFGERP